jgi:predicted DNA-binding ribbon-helix-helix protein
MASDDGSPAPEKAVRSNSRGLSVVDRELAMPLKPRKRSFYYDGLNSSFCLEEPFWTALKQIAASEQKSVSDLVRSIDASRITVNRSSSMRVFILEYYKARAEALARPVTESERS